MAPDNTILLEILRDACRAPSGDNAQPWRFAIRGNIVRVINVPENDTSPFNWQQISNHVALGAVVENLRISAEAHGFRTSIALFPDENDRLVVAEVTLAPDLSIRNDLAPFIASRATNRKNYHAKAIEPEKFSELSALASGQESRIAFVTDSTTVNSVARIVSIGEKLAIENKSIHDFLFDHVTWTKEEDAVRHGFFIDTFEFIPPQRIAFRLFRNWNILKLFLPFGISNVIARDTAKVHATAAAFGAIIVPNGASEDFLKAGMLLERLWLTAQRLGLSLQPTTTVHLIGTRILAGDPGDLSLMHQKLLRENYAALAARFLLKGTERFGFVFRLGYAETPSARTTRSEPNIVWL